MKIIPLLFLSSLILTVSFGSCNKIKKTDAEIERENWIAGFSDSIEFYQERSRQIESTLEGLNSKINELISDFELVQNPREVSGYYLLKGWKDKIPLTSTGIYARLNENEKLELIATLSGGTFNQIGVTEGGEEFYSEIVPHDQAFNYRHDRFNTVYFNGGKADTIAEFIAANRYEKINLQFIENGKRKNFALPDNEKNMIYQTWDLYDYQCQVKKLQKELWICSKKIETFRRIMSDEPSVSMPEDSHGI